MKKLILFICLFVSVKAFSQVSQFYTVVAVDSSNTIITYQWTQISGSAVVKLTSFNTDTTTATFPIAGTYVLQCTGKNGLGSTSSATTTAIIVPKISVSISPSSIKLTLQ